MFQFIQVLFIVIFASYCNALKNPCKKGDGSQYFPHPDTNTKYIQCSQWGQMFIFTCPEGLIWSEENAVCDHESSSRRLLQAITKSAPISVEEINFAFDKMKPLKATMLKKTVSFMTENKAPNDGFCLNVAIKGATMPIDGLYTRVNTNSDTNLPIYKRSDDVRSFGIIAPLSNFWCITYSFFDMKNLSLSHIAETCGKKLDCCIVLSNMNDGIALTDPKKAWVINQMENKGHVDLKMSVQCSTGENKELTSETESIETLEKLETKFLEEMAELRIKQKSIFDQQQQMFNDLKSMSRNDKTKALVKLNKSFQEEMNKLGAAQDIRKEAFLLNKERNPKVTKVEVIQDSESLANLEKLFDEEIEELHKHQKSLWDQQQKLFSSAKSINEQQKAKLLDEMNRSFQEDMNKLAIDHDQRRKAHIEEMNKMGQSQTFLIKSSVDQQNKNEKSSAKNIIDDTLNNFEINVQKELEELKNKQKILFDQQQKLLNSMPSLSTIEKNRQLTELSKLFQQEMDKLASDHTERRNKLTMETVNKLDKPIIMTSPVVSQSIQTSPMATDISNGNSQEQAINQAMTATDIESVFNEEINNLKNEQKTIFEQQQQLFKKTPAISATEQKRILEELNKSFQVEMKKLATKHEDMKRTFQLNKSQLLTPESKIMSPSNGITNQDLNSNENIQTLEELENVFSKELSELRTKQKATFDQQVKILQNVPQDEKNRIINLLNKSFQEEMNKLAAQHDQRKAAFENLLSNKAPEVKFVQANTDIDKSKIAANMPKSLDELENTFTNELNSLRAQQKSIFEQQQALFRSTPSISSEEKRKIINDLNKSFQDEMNKLAAKHGEQKKSFEVNFSNSQATMPLVQQENKMRTILPKTSPVISDSSAKSINELEEIFNQEISNLRAQQKVNFDNQTSALDSMTSEEEKNALVTKLNKFFQEEMNTLVSKQNIRRNDWLKKKKVVPNPVAFKKTANVLVTNPTPVNTVSTVTSLNPIMIITPTIPNIQVEKASSLEDLEKTFMKELTDLRIQQKKIFDEKQELFKNIMSQDKRIEALNNLNKMFQEEMNKLAASHDKRKEEFEVSAMVQKTVPQSIQTQSSVSNMNQVPKAVPKVSSVMNSPAKFSPPMPVKKQSKIIPIISCDFVKCLSDSVCAINPTCDTCNPGCFVRDKPLVAKNAKLDCSNIVCPESTKCSLDTSDKKFKCIS